MPYANNKGADQPAHPRSLISTFIVHYLDSLIYILDLSKVSRFYLASAAERAGLNPWRQVFAWCGTVNCLADHDHGQTVQSLVKCGSCHCSFRLLQIFLPLFSWNTLVNLNSQSGSQYLTKWLLIYCFRWNCMKAPAAAEPEFFCI